VQVPATIQIPENARGAVIFVSQEGDSRFNRADLYIAEALNMQGIATVLPHFDVAQSDERDESHLARRLSGELVQAALYLLSSTDIVGMKIGFMCSGYATAAGILAAAELPSVVSCIVSRGGRPDLAHRAVDHLRAPILLIIGGKEQNFVWLNQKAFIGAEVEHVLAVLPDAHRFCTEETDLAELAKAATNWFGVHLKHTT
jgi:hypothetical protein